MVSVSGMLFHPDLHQLLSLALWIAVLCQKLFDIANGREIAKLTENFPIPVSELFLL